MQSRKGLQINVFCPGIWISTGNTSLRTRAGSVQVLGPKRHWRNRLLPQGSLLPHAFSHPSWEGREAGTWCPSSHGLFPRQSSVIEGVHVYHFLSFDDGGRLRFLFESPPTLQRHGQLVHHGATKRALENQERKKKERIETSVTSKLRLNWLFNQLLSHKFDFLL